MYAEDDLLPVSALQHLLFCPRQCALIHVERLWAENSLTLEGRHLHQKADHGRGESRRPRSGAGRRAGAAGRAGGGGGVRIARGLLLRSLALGLYGKADVVEFRSADDPDVTAGGLGRGGGSAGTGRGADGGGGASAAAGPAAADVGRRGKRGSAGGRPRRTKPLPVGAAAAGGSADPPAAAGVAAGSPAADAASAEQWLAGFDLSLGFDPPAEPGPSAEVDLSAGVGPAAAGSDAPADPAASADGGGGPAVSGGPPPPGTKPLPGGSAPPSASPGSPPSGSSSTLTSSVPTSSSEPTSLTGSASLSSSSPPACGTNPLLPPAAGAGTPAGEPATAETSAGAVAAAVSVVSAASVATPVPVASTVSFAPSAVPFPVEYKRGKPKANRCDEVQLCAQALCLEEMLGVPVPAGAIFYGKTRARVRVAFDATLRALTLGLVADLRAMVDEGRTPAAEREKKCDRCSLVKLCLPEARPGTTAAGRYLARAVGQSLAAAEGPKGE